MIGLKMLDWFDSGVSLSNMMLIRESSSSDVCLLTLSPAISLMDTKDCLFIFRQLKLKVMTT